MAHKEYCIPFNELQQAIGSDSAMELLAQLVKAELEKYANIDQLVKQHIENSPSDDETLFDFLFKEEENLLVSKFGAEYDADLDKQKIKRGTRCYNRRDGEYVVFISDVKADTATDGYNCIVAPDGKLPIPANVPLRFAMKCELVQEY